MAAKVLRHVEGPTNPLSPCITLVNGFYCVLEGDKFVAVDRNTGKTSSSPFKPVQWSESISQLGKNILEPSISNIL